VKAATSPFTQRRIDWFLNMTNSANTKKKLIEVALPLEAINVASAREKSIRHGHPSTLHLWWARRPLAAARAVIFAQMVDDPSSNPDLFPTEKKQEKERERLFDIIRELVKWDNTTNETVLQKAKDEIWQSWRRACAENADHPRARELFDRHHLPGFHDPFAGGGALPLEAQRLGLESHASDLNPVAVLINKAMIEIPPKFAGRPPVNPSAQSELARGGHWNGKGAQGLGVDVRYYGQWMRDEAEKRIGHLYPKLTVTDEMVVARPDLIPLVGHDLTVVAWLWARTVKSPNPAFSNVDVPLISSFLLSPMAGKEAWIEPIIDGSGYLFTVKLGKPKDLDAVKSGTKLARGANFRCLMSDTPIVGDYIKAEGRAGRMGARLMAIVAEGARGRVYLAPTPEHEAAALSAKPDWEPEQSLPDDHRNFWTVQYGLTTYGDLFSDRQLVALTTFSDLVSEAMARVRHDAGSAGFPDNDTPLRDGGNGATAYAESVALYLSFLIGKLADKGSTLCTWDAGPAANRTASGRSARVATVRVTFGRQALPMTWDFAEVNFFSDSVGSIDTVLKTLTVPIDYLPTAVVGSIAKQSDAQTQEFSYGKVVSTDPPYYDNIGYADLSDFFYVWLRRSLRPVFPDLFATLGVPKTEELVATPYRHGSKERAESFFLEGMTQAMHRLAGQAHPGFPVTIYYAFKQSETESAEGISSTGWETFLDALIRAGFGISGTWPMRTELSNRMIGSGTNALASSIILVCRPRNADALTATRRDFVVALKAELPSALRHLQAGNIAPVDLAQAAIGPGMGIYTRYERVLDAAGKPVSVRDALALINATLDDALAEQEGDFDADSRWALAWFEQYGFAEGEYGVAETLSKAKNTSVAGLAEAGILDSRRGKVRLLKPEELPANWNPATDPRLTAWEVVHHLIRALSTGGEAASAQLVAQLGTRAETARELAYRLYTLCERKKRAAEALAYNGLVQSWPEIARLVREGASTLELAQPDMFGRA
jgi:putative DNA methylase